MSQTTKVLVVDDSLTARLALRRALESVPDIRVVAEASTGAEALRHIARYKPDIATMDVYLRDENGIDVTAEIMTRCPLPILIITGTDPNDPGLAFRAMESGALDVRPKLPPSTDPTYADQHRQLMRLIKALSKVPVVTRHRRNTRSAAPAPAPAASPPVAEGFGVVVVGASTGGPPVLRDLLEAIPAPYPLPITIVQHISEGFVDSMASWLASDTGHRIDVVRCSEPLAAGRVYLPADDRHLVLQSSSSVGLSSDPPRKYQRPSVDHLFESAAEHFGAGTIAVLLTGMGSDGAKGMQALHRSGAVTIAQQPESCVVDSMPRRAMEFGAVKQVLAPDEISAELVRLARTHAKA